MRKTTLFIAMSLDGFIARKDGDVSWLIGQHPGEDDMVSYENFIKDMDTVVMGWNTYHQIAEELLPGQWPYQSLTSYVITHRQLPEKDNILFRNQNPCDFVKTLKQTAGKGIWICGGANLVQPLIQENLIDIYHFSVIPTILGNGIRLFGTIEDALDLNLVKTQSYNGITDLIYEPR